MRLNKAERSKDIVKHFSYRQSRTVVAQRAWAVKLGSGGVHIDFCEKHRIIGIGWIGVSSTGQIFKFVEECSIGDYVIYYDPKRKQVRICRVVSDALYRDFDLNDPEARIDIWHYRRVDYPVPAIPITDFYGGLKGRLLDARMFFWELPGAYQMVQQMVRSRVPQITAGDSDIKQAYATLRDLLVVRAEALNDEDWECILVDYLRAQGASVNEQNLGTNYPIIAAEGRFHHGELGAQVWRFQVERCEGRKVDWSTIEQSIEFAGDVRFCFVSVFGFTGEARQFAHSRRVRLMEPADFVLFFLSGKLRENIRHKMNLPSL